MKKEKEKKEIKFNPADYDYMDGMPLEGWFWEIIRRNSEYRTLYSELKKELSKKFITVDRSIELHKKIIQFYLFSQLINVDFKQFKFFDYDYELTQGLNNFLLMKINDGVFKEYRILPNPDTKYKDFSHRKPYIGGVSTVVSWHKFPHRYIKDTEDEFFHKYCVAIITDILSILGLRDTLYLGISMSARKEDIERELKTILKKFIKPKRKKRVRTDKWKYYLITYDLKQSGKGYPEIADILVDAYPSKNPDKTFSEKNIEYYYKNALSLISGDYKKYLLPFHLM